MTRRLSVVIPALNEAIRLPPTLRAISEYVRREGMEAEVIVVDDGSEDRTAEVAAAESTPRVPIRVLRNESNRGKGFSVRRGVSETCGDLVLMVDADLSTPMEELPKLLASLDRGADVAIGSRDRPDSVLDPPQRWMRRVTSRVFRELRGCVLLADLYDTQCGFKLFRGDVAREVFPLLQTEAFAFDVEVLWLARCKGYRIVEVGVLWRNSEDSRVRAVRDGFSMLRDVLRIRMKWPAQCQ